MTLIKDENKRQSGAGSILDKVEKEDEEIVENVQKGVKSRFYKNGRFSPKMEKGVHQWDAELENFVKVMPIEYKRALNEMKETKKKEVA